MVDVLSQTVPIPQATRAKLDAPNVPSQAEGVSLETEPCRDVQLERSVPRGHDMRTAGAGSCNKGLILHYSILRGGEEGFLKTH